MFQERDAGCALTRSRVAGNLTSETVDFSKVFVGTDEVWEVGAAVWRGLTEVARAQVMARRQGKREGLLFTLTTLELVRTSSVLRTQCFVCSNTDMQKA